MRSPHRVRPRRLISFSTSLLLFLTLFSAGMLLLYISTLRAQIPRSVSPPLDHHHHHTHDDSHSHHPPPPSSSEVPPYPAPVFTDPSVTATIAQDLANKEPTWWFRPSERTSVPAPPPQDAITSCQSADFIPTTTFPLCLPFLPLGIDETCVAYSFHSEINMDFEVALAAVGCQVHYFGSSESPAAITAHAASSHSLDTIMSQLGHSQISLLRASSASLSSLLPSASVVTRVGQLYFDPSPSKAQSLHETLLFSVVDGHFRIWYLHPDPTSTRVALINTRLVRLYEESRLRESRRRARAGVILYLSSPGQSSSYGKGDHRGDKLKQSLTLLSKHYNAHSKHDVVILYTLDRPFSREQQRALAVLHPPGVLRFRPLAGQWWDPPVDSSKHKSWHRPGFSLGYRSMCRFFAVLVWQYMGQLGYEYVWRLDDDSFIHSTVVPSDMFAHLRERGCNYGFRIGTYDNNDRDNFFVFVDKYLADSGLSATHGNFSLDGKSRRTREIGPDYYTNLFMGRVSFFTEPRVRSFLEYVDRSGNIFYRRWGDLPIQSVTVHLFSHPEQICYIDSFTYEHISMQGGECASSGVMQRGANVSLDEWRALVETKWAFYNCDKCGGETKGCFRSDMYFGPQYAVSNNLKRFGGTDPGLAKGSLWGGFSQPVND